MTDTDTVIVGAGHAGLAVSRLLSAAGHEHVVLERGRVGERWRSQRWDSLHLVTPSWMTRLPGWRYDGPDPDGYLSAAAFADFLDDYATSFRCSGDRVGLRSRTCPPRRQGPVTGMWSLRMRVCGGRGRWCWRPVRTAPRGCRTRSGPARWGRSSW